MNSNSSNYKDSYQKIKDKFEKIEQHGSLDLNRDNDYLNEIFSKNSFLDLDLFWNYSLYYYFSGNSIEYMYFRKQAILTFIKCIKKIIKELKNKKELPLYEKIRVIYSSFTLLFMKKNSFLYSYEITNMNIRYLITEKAEKNSIIERFNNFYNSFTDSISEDSAVFPYLLNIDGGSGFYNEEEVYTFDLKNVDMIKSHLKQVFPKIIILCYLENGEVALTESEFGGIIINEYYLSKVKNLDYNSSKLNQITEEEKDDIAMNFFLDNIHEASGIKNLPFLMKKIIHLKKYLSSHNNINKGDSGHYLELCYGKYKNELIIDILRNMKNKGKLIKYPKLFTDDIETLNEYVSLRKQIEENNMSLEFKYEAPINDDIKQMKIELEKIKILDNKNEIIIEPKSNINETSQNDFLKRGKRNRDKEDIDNNIDKDDNVQNKKKYATNYLKSNIIDEKEKIKKDNTFDKKDQKDEIDYSNLEEVLKIAEKRVVEKFNIKLGPGLKGTLKDIKANLNPKDPIYHDINILLYHSNIKF